MERVELATEGFEGALLTYGQVVEEQSLVTFAQGEDDSEAGEDGVEFSAADALEIVGGELIEVEE